MEYEKGSMYDAIRKAAMRFPHLTACDFMGQKTTYKLLMKKIDNASKAFHKLGIRDGDKVLLCLPNCLTAVICLYGLNKIGAVVTPIHPLSNEYEIKIYLKLSKSNWAITLDRFVHKFIKIQSEIQLKGVIFRSLGSEMPFYIRMIYEMLKKEKVSMKKVDSAFISWKELKKKAKSCETLTQLEPVRERAEDLSVILFSGGTTGKPKGVMLTNSNFNALALQIGARGHSEEHGGKMLGILPIFHGYGMGICIHSFLYWGSQVLLIPVFTPEKIGKLIRKKKPSFFPTIPRILEDVLKTKDFQKADLSCLKHINCGGDKLPEKTRKRLKQRLKANGAKVSLVEGYGLTETVAGCMAMPEGENKPGSIGKPFPDMLAKIVVPGTIKEVLDGTDGEICINGPTVMLGYLDDPQETSRALKTHEDGRVWLHTGDIGYKDQSGYFYFKIRMKRIIKVSGMAVFPVQVEEVINMHQDVVESCVIGVPDPVKGQKIKAVVVLNEPVSKDLEGKKSLELINWCKDHLIPLRCPKEIQFRHELPRTKLGKTDYRALEKENGVRVYE